MKFKPLHDRVLIEVLDSSEKTAGGIIIPDTAQEKPQEGKVVAVGGGAKTEDGKIIPMDVKVGDKVTDDAAWMYPDTKEKRPDMRGYYAFDWHKMDAWYEENEEIIGHPRNPYHRVDTIQSDRHIRIEVEGITVAESTRPVLLFETGLPTRYYIPKDDVTVETTPTETHTICPYKGVADYWQFEIDGKDYQDLIWGYHQPFNESLKIKDLVAFYDEKVDVYVDGELQDRPRTVFS